jgi:hypothetical protein
MRRFRTAEGRAARDAIFLEWRRQGLTYQEIADRAGCAVATAWMCVRAAEGRADRERAEHAKEG